MSITVVQWTSGGVARETIKAIVSHPDLELVGLYAYSAEKVGMDAGELAGIAPLGIAASNDIDALIALQPDCVSYSPLYPDINELERILRAGINVVTTCNFMNGWGLDFNAERFGANARARLHQAALDGNASLFGTGINPGHINYLACVLTSVCEEVTHIQVTEAVDVTHFVADPNIDAFGFGEPLGDDTLYERSKAESAVFGDALQVMAQLMGLQLEEVRCSIDYAIASHDVQAPGKFIASNTVGGVRLRWEGLVNNRPVLENQQIWTVGDIIEDSWKVDRGHHGYVVNIQGNPNIHNVMLPIPRGDISTMNHKDFNALGMRITGLPSINAIAAVCAAAPGICTYNALPPVTARGRFRVDQA
ncbi:MAG: dihydrodipicolinate reductase [Gammaproteobacteria bacterium]|nr:dihydrodipicolinate reductase [Gammaproteobacteria bacterium]